MAVPVVPACITGAGSRIREGISQSVFRARDATAAATDQSFADAKVSIPVDRSRAAHRNVAVRADMPIVARSLVAVGAIRRLVAVRVTTTAHGDAGQPVDEPTAGWLDAGDRGCTGIGLLTTQNWRKK